MRAWIWRELQRRLADEGAPTKALAALKKDSGAILWGGQAAPALLLLLGLFLDAGWLVFLGALSALAGGWYMKMTIIVRAAFNQGFALPVLPVRGAGKPGKGVKPGWSGGRTP